MNSFKNIILEDVRKEDTFINAKHFWEVANKYVYVDLETRIYDSSISKEEELEIMCEILVQFINHCTPDAYNKLLDAIAHKLLDSYRNLQHEEDKTREWNRLISCMSPVAIYMEVFIYDREDKRYDFSFRFIDKGYENQHEIIADISETGFLFLDAYFEGL